MSFDRIEHAGGAVDTTLASDITSLDDALTLTDSTAWPTGAVGPFYVLIDPGTASEEKMLATSLSGNVLSGIVRGQDGTGAFDHSAGVTVKHVYAAVEADEANQLVNQTLGGIATKGDLPVGASANVIDVLGIGADNLVMTTASLAPLGVAWQQVNENHLATTVAGNGLGGGNGTPLVVNVDGATFEITTDALNVKALGVGNTQLADGAVTVDKLGASAVTSAKIADATIVAADIAPATLTAALFAATAWTAYTPTFSSVSTGGGSVSMTVGNSVVEGAYIQYGKTVHFRCSVTLGSSFSGGASVIYTLTLPVAPKSGVRQVIGGAAIGPASHTTTVLSLSAYTDIAGGTTTEQIGLDSSVNASATYNILGAAGNPVTSSAWAQDTVFQLTGTYEAN